MKGPRAIGLGLLLGLALAAFFTSDAQAQMGRGGGGKRPRDPLPDQSASPRSGDPAADDAIDLFSRLCVSTRGNRETAVGIVGDGDTAIEKMSEPLLRGMQNGQSGGVGWIIRMPLGDRILLEFPPDGTCVVRAPRVNPARIEAAFQELLQQYSASGQFDVRHTGEATKAFDPPAEDGSSRNKAAAPGGERHQDDGKLKVHFTAYTMRMPDTGKVAELGLATTDSRAVNIQATLTYIVQPDGSSAAKP
jgi:hypothetical protein